MAKYVIRAGWRYDRATKQLQSTGDVVDFTEAQAKAFGLQNLSRLDEEEAAATVVDEPKGATAAEVLAEVQRLPAAEAVELANKSGLLGEPVSAKTAAVAALQQLISAE